MAKISVRNRNKNYPNRQPCWEYRFETAKVGGKRSCVSRAGFKTKKEALAAGAKALAEYNNSGQKFSPSKISVSDFLDYWVENYAEVNVANTSLGTYVGYINNHIKPAIGKYMLSGISSLTLQKMINDYSNKVSRKAMVSLVAFIKSVFKYAKNFKLIGENPAEDITLPKMVAQNHRVRVLEKETITEVLKLAKNNPEKYYGVLIGYYTGMRVSEIYGLTWDCVDFEKKELIVNKSVKTGHLELQGEKGSPIWYLGDCKTPSSNRVIKIGESLLTALETYKREQEKNKIEFGGLYHTYYLRELTLKNGRKMFRIVPSNEITTADNVKRVDFVMVKPDGRFKGYHSAIELHASAKRHGLKFSFHDLRHTHATLLIEGGALIKDVQERLGHSNIGTTMNIYVDNTEKMREQTVEIFEKMNRIE